MIAKQEYLQRIARLAALLQQQGIGAAVLTADSNIDYFSGYRHHAPWTLFARPFVLVVSAEGKAVFLAHGFLEPEARRTAAISDVRTYAKSGGAPLDEINAILDELGAGRQAIGMELGYEQRLGISVNDFLAFREQRAAAGLRDIADLLWCLRMIKSPAEIALLRKSAEITREAFAAAFAAVRPSVTEETLGRIAGETMLHLGAERPGLILATSGASNYHVLSGKPSQRKLERGDMIWLDMGAVYKGYWSDFCRAAYLGPRRTEIDDDQKIIVSINQAAVEAAKPGAPISEVARAAAKELKASGIDVDLGFGRIGHGIGLMSTEPPHVALYDDTPCVEGLTFTIEPRFVRPHGIFNCEELLVITSNGAEVITDAPREITYIQ
jgi:Xaa-Pro aminopeptidase